ncbi:hypothetical protein NC651_016615 [Populus alba x Populus x berolinensis]|nr:hypothetical protein NC651_016615 [Populus alba x Populus x berolinensis]
MAGTDTSALTIQWILAELINHQKIFNRLREEIDLVVGKKRLVKESDILNLPYLQAVVKETLRLHPPSPIILGQCAEDCKINGFDLKGKTRMLINPYSIQRDPNSWTDPEEFNPDRFMVDSNINQMEPFGSGRRGCPASSLALVVVQAAIGALVQCFDWEVIGEGKINLQEDSGFSVGIASPLV